jgi:2-polyprenyl-6-methoxyphenol hydroxylase-like FAD-dependent oxidoreductase
MAEEIHYVLIVGGGPVGLAMTAMLGKASHKARCLSAGLRDTACRGSAVSMPR